MTLSTIEARVRRLLGNLTSTDYSDANIDESVEQYYHTLTVAAIEASGEWRVSGEIATSDIVADQAEYVLPADLISIDRIEVNFTGETGQWERVKIVDDRTEFNALSNNASQTTPSALAYMHDNSFFFVTPPSANSTTGLKIWYSQEPSSLTDDVEPNLPESTHDGLVYGACLDFSMERKLSKEMEMFKALYEEKEQEVKNYYAFRGQTKPARFVPRPERYV